MPNLKIVALSDTHNWHRSVEVPDGDILIFAGDFMTCGYKYHQVQSFASWFNNLPHKYKIFISGNHDRLMESQKYLCLNEFANNVIYLEDSSCEIEGFKFWGSPYTPEFCNWAFNVPRGTLYEKHWSKIPVDVDVLITHGPPLGVLDSMGALYDNGRFSEAHVGDPELRDVVDKIKPKVHIFGHIHNGYGSLVTIGTDWQKKPVFYNASICNEAYQPVNKPHIIELYK